MFLQSFGNIRNSVRKHGWIKKSLEAPIRLLFPLFLIIPTLVFVHAKPPQLDHLDTDAKISQLFAFYVAKSDVREDFKSLAKQCEDGVGMLILTDDFNNIELAQISEFASQFSSKPIFAFIPQRDKSGWPESLTIGSLRDNTTLRSWSEAAGETLRQSGFRLLLDPFPGISNSRELPDALAYSMGEDWEDVASKCVVQMEGFMNSGVQTVALDFPGFPNTGESQAFRVDLEEERIQGVEMMPYKELIGAGISVIQMSSSLIRQGEEYLPFFLSDHWTNKVLRKKLEFGGLIISADITRVSNWYNARNGEIELQAFEAGNQLLLNPENTNATKRRIRSAIRKNGKLENRLNEAVKQILELKKTTSEGRNLEMVEMPDMQYDRVLRESITVFDTRDLIPLKYLDTLKIAAVHFENPIPNTISVYLDKYAAVEHFNLRDKFNYYQKFEEILQQLETFNTIILPLGSIADDATNHFGMGEQVLRFIKDLKKDKEVVVLSMGNPRFLDEFEEEVSVVHAYDVSIEAEKLLPQILFGAKAANGKLPFSTEKYPGGAGKKTEDLGRLDYVYPEEVNINPEVFAGIEEVIREALEDKATPGCQILVAKNGHIVLEKGYGYLSYDSANPVTTETVYDVASITKAAATLQAIMKLSEMDVIDINKTASQYLVDLRKTNKDNLFISDILAHQAGLTPYIPYWKQTINEGGLDDRYYCNNPDDWFCVEVVPGIYSIRSMEDSLWKWTIESELRKPNKEGSFGYRYSDLGFYILKKLVERRTRQPIEEFLEENFYRPLGMSKLTFFPMAHFDLEDIAPTEEDDYFRQTVVRGTVHDQGAAMFGGVGGHAGLFSNANDLAKLLQMNMNRGEYAGQRYFMTSTIETFTSRHFKGNRRGLGWDKPLRSGNGPTSDLCSYNTFGHTGFTGTAMWADPDYDLIYVFLSNRIHPDVNNRKLIKQNIRTRIQDIIYESIFINDVKTKG
jgi:CubicO group peptidase (beta-lactamase class C family)/beta-glucosidase-like glycosyl hydrolase